MEVGDPFEGGSGVFCSRGVRPGRADWAEGILGGLGEAERALICWAACCARLSAAPPLPLSSSDMPMDELSPSPVDLHASPSSDVVSSKSFIPIRFPFISATKKKKKLDYDWGN